MGIIYLFTLIFLITYFRKKILFRSNNYLLLVFILIFSYLIPLSYGLFRIPVLTDRYIIFVLIPILILISVLLFEINNKKLRLSILILVLISTFVNNYIEIAFRKNTKPEFTNLIDNLKKNEINNLTLYTPLKTYTEIVENYIVSTKEYKNYDFNIFKINNLPPEIKKIWVICYEPLVGYNCTITADKKNWILINTKKMYLVNAKLYEIIN